MPKHNTINNFLSEHKMSSQSHVGDRVAELHNKNNAMSRLHSRVIYILESPNGTHIVSKQFTDQTIGADTVLSKCVLQGIMSGLKERKAVKQVLMKCSRQTPDHQQGNVDNVKALTSKSEPDTESSIPSYKTLGSSGQKYARREHTSTNSHRNYH